MTTWIKNWIKKGWKTATNKEIQNLELIQKLYEYVNKYNVKFKHTYSHKNAPENKDSEDYYMWYGNYMADKNASKSLIK
jgi:ribonuclease HI